MKTWPKGYLQEEASFCKEELDNFYSAKDDVEIEKLRILVLQRRELFTKHWKNNNE